MIISTASENAVDKTQNPFRIFYKPHRSGPRKEQRQSMKHSRGRLAVQTTFTSELNALPRKLRARQARLPF